ncbi:hypothetical protein EK904_012517 [Melospiza melodia maxima]|nr:hypothetical protein EK904_012517 [Melospiza melodia maxima]
MRPLCCRCDKHKLGKKVKGLDKCGYPVNSIPEADKNVLGGMEEAPEVIQAACPHCRLRHGAGCTAGQVFGGKHKTSPLLGFLPTHIPNCFPGNNAESALQTVPTHRWSALALSSSLLLPAPHICAESVASLKERVL